MKYKVVVKDTSGHPIQPVLNGSAAEHFAMCVNTAIDSINGMEVAQQRLEPNKFKRGIYNYLSRGGQILPDTVRKDQKKTEKELEILENFDSRLGPLLAPTLFFHYLYTHPQLTMSKFLDELGNKNVPEYNNVITLRLNDPLLIPSFVSFLMKVKIPGVGLCQIAQIDQEFKQEVVSPEQEQKVSSETKTDNLDFLKTSAKNVNAAAVKSHKAKDFAKALEGFKAAIEILEKLQMIHAESENTVELRDIRLLLASAYYNLSSVCLEGTNPHQATAKDCLEVCYSIRKDLLGEENEFTKKVKLKLDNSYSKDLPTLRMA